jgi:hypothetical protein
MRALGRGLDALIELEQHAAQIKTFARGKIKRSVAVEVLNLDVGP